MHASVKPVFFVCGKYNGVAGVLFSAPRKTDVFCRRDARPSPPNKLDNFIKRQSSPSLLLCASRRAGRRNRFFKKLPPKVNAFGGGSESSIKSRFFLYFQSHAVVSRPKAVFPLRAFQSFPKGKIVVRIVRHHIRGMYVGYLSPQKFPFHRRIVGQSICLAFAPAS